MEGLTNGNAPIFALAFAISGLCGLGWLLRSPHRVTLRSVASATLNCGMLGLIISLLYFHYHTDGTLLLLAVCGLAGIGGIKMVEFASHLFNKLTTEYLEKKFGIKLIGTENDITKDESEPVPPSEEEDENKTPELKNE
jgi:hypothetical protein